MVRGGQLTVILSYTKHPDHDFTHFISEDETSIKNWLETLIEYGTAGMTTREFYDLRHQTNLFSTEEIGMIINRSVMVEDLHPPNGKTVILVDNAEKYVLAELYAIQAENHERLSEVKVFFTLGEAIDWLGKDVAQCL